MIAGGLVMIPTLRQLDLIIVMLIGERDQVADWSGGDAAAGNSQEQDDKRTQSKIT